MLHPSDITLTDDFCGCGGSTQGAKQVPGVSVKYARNHWPRAIESHNTNHPETLHDCVNLSQVHPARYERTTGYIASPECTHHSYAGGRKTKNLNQTKLFEKTLLDPSAVKSRLTMWDVVTFAEYHRHEFIIVENVVQVREWELFDPWLRAMHNLGYLHQCVYLNAMFAHGDRIRHFAPQSRDRIYIVFWKKGNRKPDLDIRPKAPCPRCGVVEAVQSWKKGCVKKTYGKTGGYVYRCPNCHAEVLPFYYAALNCLDLSLPMVKIGERAEHGMRELSAGTIARIEYGLRKYGLRPTLLDQRNQHGTVGSRIRNAESDPLNAQTTGFSSYLFSPFLLETLYSHALNDRTRGLEAPVQTQRTQASVGFCAPFVVANRTNNVPYTLDHWLPTVTARNASLTLTSSEPTLEGFMTVLRKNGNAHDLTDTMPSITTGRNQHGLVLPPSAILTMRGPRSLDGVIDPIATQTTAIQNWLVSATPFLQPYHAKPQASLPTDALSTVPTKDSISLIEAYQQPAVEECYYRMLQPHETALAQGFPADYIITGNKEEQQRQIGNANPPPTMELLVQRCVASLL